MRLTILAAAVATSLAASGAWAQSDAAGPNFTPCEDASGPLAGSLCAVARTPLRYDAAAPGEVDLFVRRLPAEGPSRGDVWLIAGGPGEAGVSFHAVLPQLRAAFPHHDLIMPDHRGTGRSSRVCVAEEAAGSPGGVGLDGAEWASCFGALETRNAWVQSFTISNAARDLSSLIAEVSNGRETYVYGVSYGTQLVLRMMTIAPPPSVKGLVLDSLIPPETTRTEDLSHRSQVVDAVGRAVLADCDQDAACRGRLGGSAAEALRAVVHDPEQARLFPGGRPKAFLAVMLDSPEARALIPDVITDARAGRTEAITEASARLTAFAAPFAAPEARSSIPLVALISASENNARPDLTAAQIEIEAQNLMFTSSIPSQLAGGAAIAYPRDAAHGASPSRLPPVLILQGDHDPKTSHAGALAHAALFDKAGPVQFITARGAPHFVLLTRPDCAVDALGDFVAGAPIRTARCD